MKQKKENNFPLMARYLKGNIRYFAAAILCSVLSTVCNSLTPQIISVTIDSILGNSEYTLPEVLARFTTLDALRADVGKTLLIAAGAIVVIAAIGGIGSFGTRTATAMGSEGFVKGLRDALFHIFSGCLTPGMSSTRPVKSSSAVHLMSKLSEIFSPTRCWKLSASVLW